MNQKFFTVKVTSKIKEFNDWDTVDSIALEYETFSGQSEYLIEEEEVDKILGDRAYSGGDIPESVIDEIDFLKKKSKDQVLYCFCGDNSQSDIMNFMEQVRKNLGDNFLFEEKTEENLDWNQEWRKYYAPIVIDEKKLIIVPEWQKNEFLNINHAVFIYPGMGFGTGTHETTFLCLKLMLKSYTNREFQNVLDFGCGSGILGISAMKFGPSKVVFCDIDENALHNTKQNLELNFIQEKIIKETESCLRSSFNIDQKYDLIFANILEDTLLKEKNIILESLAIDGILIVSGLLQDQVENIKKEYTNNTGLCAVDILLKGHWGAILFLRQS